MPPQQMRSLIHKVTCIHTYIHYPPMYVCIICYCNIVFGRGLSHIYVIHTYIHVIRSCDGIAVKYRLSDLNNNAIFVLYYIHFALLLTPYF